jgi:hypothetical protein
MTPGLYAGAPRPGYTMGQGPARPHYGGHYLGSAFVPMSSRPPQDARIDGVMTEKPRGLELPVDECQHTTPLEVYSIDLRTADLMSDALAQVGCYGPDLDPESPVGRAELGRIAAAESLFSRSGRFD